MRSLKTIIIGVLLLALAEPMNAEKVETGNNVYVTIYDTVCEGYPYNNNGFSIANPLSQTYWRTITGGSSTGSDSIVCLYLTVEPSSKVIYDTICQGGTYRFGYRTEALTQTGVYSDTMLSSFGCPYLYTLHLYVVDSATHTYATICQGESYTFMGQTYTQAGTYILNRTGQCGCPLKAILHLTVARSDSTVVTSFCHGGSVVVADTVITTAGMYTISRYNPNIGCNTVYHVTATENPIKTVSIIDYACQGHLYYGHGLNGIVITKDTTINKIVRTWDGLCDSLCIITIWDIPTVYGTERVIMEAGDSYTWHGNTYTHGGMYQDTMFTETTGCDSVVTLYLSVLSSLDNGDKNSRGTITGIDNMSDVNVELIPNPVDANATVMVYGDFGDVVKIDVVNEFGQVVDSFVPTDYPIEVKSIGLEGIYYVRLLTRTGDVYVKKLIVR